LRKGFHFREKSQRRFSRRQNGHPKARRIKPMGLGNLF
jgi:hypothetical protein